MNSPAQLATPSQALDVTCQRPVGRWSWLLLPLVIVLLVPWLIPGYFAVPVVFDHCSVRQALQAESGTSLRLDSFQTQHGTALAQGGRFCDSPDVPLLLRGTTTLEPGTHLWVVLQGEQGQFYLQYPPVKIQAGQWSAENLRPLGRVKGTTPAAGTVGSGAPRTCDPWDLFGRFTFCAWASWVTRSSLSAPRATIGTSLPACLPRPKKWL